MHVARTSPAPLLFPYKEEHALSPSRSLGLSGSLIVIHTVCSTDTSTRISYLPSTVDWDEGIV